MQSFKPPRLGDILVSHGVLTAEQLQLALEQQQSAQERLGTVIITNGWADEEQITRARAVQMDVQYVNIVDEELDNFAVTMISADVAARYLMLPLSLEGDDSKGAARVRVAMANPWDVEAIDLVQRLTKRRVEPLLASEGTLQAAINSAYHESRGSASTAAMDDTIEQASVESGGYSANEDVDVADTLRDSAPVIRFVNSLFSDAIRRRASDIHIEPRKKDFLIRYRIDGRLQEIRRAPRSFLAATVSRIKIMAEMDISEKRLPLDGRIAVRIEGKGVDLRVSTLPTQYGERVVMRILDRSTACLSLDELGFSERNLKAFSGLIRKPHGIILVTGPTGSGKTTTLYAALSALKSPDTNILTCEDPIEYELEGIGQSNLNERAGLTFAKQLRAILRQDPDIVLVGEIRDHETAEIAFRAALTGHLVLSTLHCNEAASTPSRLADMGVEPFLIASTLIGVIGQRLVRRLCPSCRKPYSPSPDELLVYQAMGGKPDPDLKFYKAPGCDKCERVGTKGRLAVHEVLVVDTKIHRLTMERADTEQLRRAALSSGMIPMATDALLKAQRGLTSLDDVERKVGTLTELD